MLLFLGRWSEYLSATGNHIKKQSEHLISLTSQKYRCIHNLLKTEPERKVNRHFASHFYLHPPHMSFHTKKATILRLQQQVIFGHSWPWNIKSVARLRYHVWSCYNIFSDFFILFHLFYFLLSILGTFHYPFWYVCLFGA